MAKNGSMVLLLGLGALYFFSRKKNGNANGDLADWTYEERFDKPFIPISPIEEPEETPRERLVVKRRYIRTYTPPLNGVPSPINGRVSPPFTPKEIKDLSEWDYEKRFEKVIRVTAEEKPAIQEEAIHPDRYAKQLKPYVVPQEYEAKRR